MKEIIQITTTCEKQEDAERIVAQLLSERFIACGQISGPIRSHYRWQGENVNSLEFTLRVKTAAYLLPRIMARIKDLHPYDVPEIIGEKVESVHEPYADWVHAEVQE